MQHILTLLPRHEGNATDTDSSSQVQFSSGTLQSVGLRAMQQILILLPMYYEGNATDTASSSQQILTLLFKA